MNCCCLSMPFDGCPRKTIVANLLFRFDDLDCTVALNRHKGKCPEAEEENYF